VNFTLKASMKMKRSPRDMRKFTRRAKITPRGMISRGKYIFFMRFACSEMEVEE